MNQKTGKKEQLNGRDFLPCCCFLYFILCSVFTILIGSRVYGNIRARNDAAFYSDSALSYITNKVRQSDRTGSISVRTVEGQSILVLASDYDGILYETWVYTKTAHCWSCFPSREAASP